MPCDMVVYKLLEPTNEISNGLQGIGDAGRPRETQMHMIWHDYVFVQADYAIEALGDIDEIAFGVFAIRRKEYLIMINHAKEFRAAF